MNSGQTLPELISAIAIISILSAFSLSVSMQLIDSAQYAKADMQMRAIANEISAYHAEFGSWPPDSPFENQSPRGISQWESPPWDAAYDYEHWAVDSELPNGEKIRECVVFLGFTGKHGKRKWPFYKKPPVGKSQKDTRKKLDGNMILEIASYRCDRPKGSVR
ncbi:MAG TPA: prepilin-type N-terminal cleavage/methylation domain-containing protein [Allocoleopsis sp.]